MKRLIPTSVLVAPVAILWLLGATLTGDERLGFRDVGHFYTPLYDYVTQRQREEWVPLWNPLDHTGIPLIGETTTAVFYPIRILVYALPIPAESALAWYVAFHLILASATAWLAARWSGASSLAAGFASVAYSLSGSVFFLYTNPPFLVGAAWLPLVLAALNCRNAFAAKQRIALASLTLAMMILGGDPQSAVHAMILVGLVLGLRRVTGTPSPITLRIWLVTGLLAACLAAPQVAASMQWSQQSDRAEQQEAIGSAFQRAEPGSKRSQAFQYSIPPWHAIELITPRAFGSLFPVHQRISQLLPEDGRMWTPTLYMGMLLAFGGAIRLLRWRQEGIDSWLGIALFALITSMGHFGLLWWVQASTGMLSSLDSAAGGPYWFLYWLLPGYDALRFPAKWLPFFAIGAAISTAHQLDQPSSLERLRRLMVPGMGVLLVAAIASWTGVFIYRLVQSSAPGDLPQDEFWGPLQVGAALTEISWSLVHSCIATALLAFLLWRHGRANWPLERFQILAFTIVALDLTLAARGLIVRVPQRTERQLLSQMTPVDSRDSHRWMRTRSERGWPRAWLETSDHHREIEVEVSSRESWFGRWHLAEQQAVFNSMTSIRSLQTARFWRAARNITSELRPDEQARFWARIRQWLEITAVAHTTAAKQEIALQGDRYQLVECLRRLQTDASPELAEAPLRPHHHWVFAEPNTKASVDIESRLRQIASRDASTSIDNASSPSSVDQPVVHARRESSIASPLPSGSMPKRPPRIELRESGPQQARYDVELAQPTLLSRVVYQDGNWSASYQSTGSQTWKSTPVLAVDFLKQGVLLPAGTYSLRFQYRPWWLTGALWTAAISWSVLLIYLPMQKRLKTRSKMSSV